MIKKTRSSPSSTKTKARENFLALAPALSIALVALVAQSAMFYAPPKKGQMAVFFSPNTSQIAAFNAVSSAGGSFVGSSRFSNIIIVYAPDTGFRERISKQGGWFTLAAQGLCSPSNFQTQT